jgi:amino acid permease
MTNDARPFRRATYAMIGTVIGAGTFAIPLAFSQMGILAGSIAYWLVALIILATHLLFVEAVLWNRSMEKKRLPGYLEIAFGSWAKRLGYLTQAAQITGACLAYLVLGGEFLSVLAGRLGLPDQVLLWQFLFWAGGAGVVFVGLKLVARIEAVLTIALILLLGFAIGVYAPQADSALFGGMRWGAVMPLLGVIMCSMFGWGVIPEVSAMCGHDRSRTRLAVAFGSLAAALLMWLFGVFAYAAIGDSLGGDPAELSRGLPASLFWLIPAVGFLAVATSFITLVQDFKAMLHLDAKLPKKLAWAVALGSPLVLLAVTSRDFLGTVGFVGAAVSSLNAFLLCLMARNLMNRKPKQLNYAWRNVVPLVCAGAFGCVVLWKLATIW